MNKTDILLNPSWPEKEEPNKVLLQKWYLCIWTIHFGYTLLLTIDWFSFNWCLQDSFVLIKRYPQKSKKFRGFGRTSQFFMTPLWYHSIAFPGGMEGVDNSILWMNHLIYTVNDNCVMCIFRNKFYREIPRYPLDDIANSGPFLNEYNGRHDYNGTAAKCAHYGKK